MILGLSVDGLLTLTCPTGAAKASLCSSSLFDRPPFPVQSYSVDDDSGFSQEGSGEFAGDGVLCGGAGDGAGAGAGERSTVTAGELEDLAEQLLSLPPHSTVESLPESLPGALTACLAHPHGLAALRAGEWSQELMLLVCQRAGQLPLHPRGSESLARQILLPQVLSLATTAPRTFFSSCSVLSQAFPAPTAQALLSGLLASPDAIQAPHSELMGRIIASSGWTMATVEASLRGFFEASAGDMQPALWSEHCVAMLCSLVAIGELAAPTVLALARAADGQRDAHKDSLKFAKLIHAVVVKNEAHARACSEILLRVLRRLTSFLAKPAIAVLEVKVS